MKLKNRIIATRLLFLCFLLIVLYFCLFSCENNDNEKSEAARFNQIAKTVFKEVYPSLAKQILDDYKILDGTCLDLGCGPGYLSIELAKQSNLKIIGIDIDAEAVEIARSNIKRENLQTQITINEGDVQKLQFTDGMADLIVSRGSFIFWEDKVQAFREIYRVLKTGGTAFVGGGMGRTITPEKKAAIKKQLQELTPKSKPNETTTKFMMEEILSLADIQNYKILGDGPGDSGCRCGMWVEIHK